VLGILLIGFGNGGVVWAEQSVPSGLTAVLVSTTPFWMVGIERFMPQGEKLAFRQVVGLVIGFGGIVMLVWPELSLGNSSGFLGGVLATQLGCAGWAVGSVYARRRRKDENVLGGVAIQMVAAGLCLWFLALARGEWADLRFNERTSTAFVYLLLMGSIVGFSAYAYALKHLPIATVALYAYINPAIAVILGAVVLREPFNTRVAWRAPSCSRAPRSSKALKRKRMSVLPLGDPPARDQPHQEEDDRDNQQNVDEVPECVTADHAEQPQHEQNDRNRFQHGRSSLGAACAAARLPLDSATQVPGYG
jgi:uncharacterized membrane protein